MSLFSKDLIEKAITVYNYNPSLGLETAVLTYMGVIDKINLPKNYIQLRDNWFLEESTRQIYYVKDEFVH